MFNLFISSNPQSWEETPYELERNRAVIEYTAAEICERYRVFNDETINELKSFPALFATEHEQTPTRIGYISDIKLRADTIVIHFEFDPILPSLQIGALETLKSDIDLGKLELYRTHWAVKDEPIFDILIKRGFLNSEQVQASQQLRAPLPPVLNSIGEFNTSQVFIVHGHDEIAKLDVANFVSSLGLQPIILHMQASSGMTIIEKIEHYSNVGFGVVLYTPCDIGAKTGEPRGNFRARQNVVFEHGYLIGKLGRPRVAALVRGELETPNDISGVVYIGMDDNSGWQEELRIEFRNVGYNV